MKSIDCTVIGEINFDILVKKKTMRLQHGGVSNLEYATLIPGGSGNISVGTSILGLKTVFVGKAGRDMLGRIYQEDQRSNDVTTKIFFDRDLPTGIVIALIDPKGERSFLTFKGANKKLTSKEIEDSRRIIEGSKYLYVCGYSLISQRDAIQKAIEIAKDNNVKIVFDPGAYNLIQLKHELFKRTMVSCDVFCPNLEEAKAITKTQTLNGAMESLGENTEKVIAIKLGGEGSIIIHGEKTYKNQAFNTKPVDTTGAGDAFTAAIIYGLIQNLPFEVTGILANWYSAKLITSYGARNFPSRENVASFLQKL